MKQRDKYVDIAKDIAIVGNVFVTGSLPLTVCFLMAYVGIVALAYWLTVVIEQYCPVLLGK